MRMQTKRRADQSSVVLPAVVRVALVSARRFPPPGAALNSEVRESSRPASRTRRARGERGGACLPGRAQGAGAATPEGFGGIY
jgi:hypothetical protein